MDWSLLSPEEQELRSLLVLVKGPGGEWHAEERDPERCAILRQRIAASDAEMDRKYDEWTRQKRQEFLTFQRIGRIIKVPLGRAKVWILPPDNET